MNLNTIGFILGILGSCFIHDGLISIRLYLNAKDETGKRTQSWKSDHSIRVLRVIGGVIVMAIGFWMVRI